MKRGFLQLSRFSQFISFCFLTFGHQSVILIFEEEYCRRSVWLDKQGKDDCEGGCRLAGGGGAPTIWQRYPQRGSIRPLCQDGSPLRRQCASRITQFSMDQRKGDAPSTAMSFQRKSGSGWIGTWLSGGRGIQELLGPAGEWSSGGRWAKSFQLESLLQTSNFPWQSVFLRLSDAAIPSLMSNGAFYRARVEWESACLHLPLRQIQSCRDLNPPRPACKNNLSMFLRFF